MSALRIRDFQRLTGLSDSAVLSLLSANDLNYEIDPDGFISIEADSVEIRQLVDAVASLQENQLSSEHGVIVEKVARVVSEEFSSIVEQAIAHARATNSK